MQPVNQHAAYRPEIDGLRALAILLVICYHYFGVAGGYIGVDIFFVISGYLISQQIFQDLNHNRFSLIEFYAKRVRRILPPLLFMIACFITVGWFLLLPPDFKALSKHGLSGVANISNLLLWTESGYFDAPAATKPFLHLWSLGVEEQFYLVWPVAMIGVSYLRKYSSLGIIAIIVISFICNIVLCGIDSSAAFYLPASRIWELAAGGMLAYYSIQTKINGLNAATKMLSQGLLAAISTFALGMIGFAVITLDKQSMYPGYWALIPVLASLLLLLDSPNDTFKRKIFANQASVFIGRISFGLYLWHWPILVFTHLADMHSQAAKLAAFFSSFFWAWVSYQFVERPIRKLRITRSNALRFVASGLLASVALGFICFLFARGEIERSWDHELISSEYQQSKTACMVSAENGRANSINDLKACLNIKFPGQPVVVLVGDSHAFGLSLGLQTYLGQHQINLVSMPVMYCTPLSKLDHRPACARFNDWIDRQIKSVAPDLVIVFAHHLMWGDDDNYGEPHHYSDYVFERAETLKNDGAKHVLILGQIPTWIDSLPHNLNFNFLRKQLPVPEKTSIGLNQESIDMDQKLRMRAEKSTIQYLSLQQSLCDSQGCLTSVGKHYPDDLLVHDYGHLTEHGARYIADQILGPVILSTISKSR